MAPLFESARKQSSLLASGPQNKNAFWRLFCGLHASPLEPIYQGITGVATITAIIYGLLI